MTQKGHFVYRMMSPKVCHLQNAVTSTDLYIEEEWIWRGFGIYEMMGSSGGPNMFLNKMVDFNSTWAAGKTQKEAGHSKA